jgi:hypothetical protein
MCDVRCAMCDGGWWMVDGGWRFGRVRSVGRCGVWTKDVHGMWMGCECGLWDVDVNVDRIAGFLGSSVVHAGHTGENETAMVNGVPEWERGMRDAEQRTGARDEVWRRGRPRARETANRTKKRFAGESEVGKEWILRRIFRWVEIWIWEKLGNLLFFFNHNRGRFPNTEWKRSRKTRRSKKTMQLTPTSLSSFCFLFLFVRSSPSLLTHLGRQNNHGKPRRQPTTTPNRSFTSELPVVKSVRPPLSPQRSVLLVW